jgi:hypothetical protein
LQKRDLWFLITPLSVVQKGDYSDNAKKVSIFKDVMLELEKNN